MAMNLTPEEQTLYFLVQTWRDPQPPPDAAVLNWTRLVDLALLNRMQVLLDQVMTATGLHDALPPDAAQALQEGVAKYEYNARHLGHDLQQYLQFAAQIEQQVVVMKGLWLCKKIYGQDAMRPGGDIDVLMHHQDIPDALTILEEQMGYGRWWRPLLDDRYYDRHHLHQQRCNHDRSIWFEPHWLLDHPYTRLTVDYDGLLARTTPGELWGEPVRELDPSDLLLSLAIHLVKHAVYLPSTLKRPDLARLILADGMLMYFVDVAEALRHYEGAIDWDQTIELARQSGTVAVLGAVLQVCRRFLHANVPDQVLDALAIPPQGRVTTLLMNRMADHILAIYMGQEPDKLWTFLLGYQESAVFRPIRLLDLGQYLWPGSDYLQRRYGRVSAAVALRHLIRAGLRYVRVGYDTLFFTLKRKREVRQLDKQGFVWPELPPAGGG